MARKEFRGRTATVYLPAGEILTEWQNEAAQGGATISEYIFEMVEKARRPAEDVVRPDLVRENSDLKTLNRKLEQEVSLLKTFGRTGNSNSPNISLQMLPTRMMLLLK